MVYILKQLQNYLRFMNSWLRIHSIIFQLPHIYLMLLILSSSLAPLSAMKIEDFEEDTKEKSNSPSQKQKDISTSKTKQQKPKKTALQLKKDKLNRLLENVAQASNLVSEDKPPLETGAVIYIFLPPEKENTDITYEDVLQLKKGEKTEMRYWDDQSLFLTEFDKNKFLRKQTKKTRFLQFIGTLEGGVAAVAIVPLALDLLSNVKFIPQGLGGAALAFTAMTLLAPATSRQMYERMGKIGDFLFDHMELPPSKSDKKPHIQSLKIEQETKGCCKRKKCCKCTCTIPIVLIEFISSFIDGMFESVPLTMFFWKAERLHPVARGILIGPLALLYFEKAFNESQRFTNRFAHQYFTDQNNLVAQKKRILVNSVEEMILRINSKNSDKLVEDLFNLVQSEVKKLQEIVKSEKEKKDGLLEEKEEINSENQERFSIISLFLLKRQKIESYKETADQFIEENKEMEEVVNLLGAKDMQKMSNLLSDLGHVPPPKSYTQTLLENMGTFFHCGSIVSRTITLQWALNQILIYIGVSDPVAFAVSSTLSPIGMLIKSINEWETQQRAFANVKKFWPSMDFRPTRFFGNLISAAGGVLFSLVPGAIIDSALGDTVPSLLKWLLKISIYPSEFSSFYEFFREKNGNLITDLGTCCIFKTAQKRAWLNKFAQELIETLRKLDPASVDELNQMVNDTV